MKVGVYNPFRYLEEKTLRTFWFKTYLCPVCEKQFDAIRLFSEAVKVKDRDHDLKPIYDGVNALMFQLVSCPNCLYTSFEDDFKELSPSHLQVVRNLCEKLRQNLKIELSEHKNLRDAIVQYNLAAVIYTARGRLFRAAESFLKLAWLYRDAGSFEEERKALNHAMGLFLKCYTEQDLDEDQQIVALFYVGEINKLLGNKKEMMRWFSELFERFGKKDSIYLKRARQEWQEASFER
ncbi:DUF2225 domain-containing protein [Pseudothermotoga sp.]|nr:DUF2225 domain-containing protein [Pseudothermotoga sp.]MCX7813614.1 DUF2225 domain-containing protein [Pseudothermotoga sp.]MDW8139982.1 DUF2225 domain-containing protein [Pseudothermotoga sp.]